ncbi:hypothetical protein EUX98_g121 [Antrodiella citrinella]|uniref:Peroxisomal membrane protein PEX16 n=1 Tax=Antrodiella citrinella TaxID=2447956 RepID=A0A4S4N819_9APHY|nr:hypothetical protein EUX98_g121 [Antrodiella citrinella]
MSAVLAHYESFLVNNVSAISTLESSLRSITWILPGRFKDAELASEALSALLNSMSMYHDTLLSKFVHSHPKYRPLIPSTLHSRYTRAWSDKSRLYKWIARSLELVRYLELLVEMGLRRKVSVKARWRSVVFIEIIKAVLRLILLKITKRPLISPLIPEREFDPAALPELSDDASSPTLAPSSPPSSLPSTPEHFKNNHIPLPPHSLLTPPPPNHSPQPVEDYLLPKALTTADWTAEILFTLRPLVYVAAMLASDRKSNRPLLTALAFEFLSRNLRRVPSSSSSLERSEYAKRDRDIVWYLLRGSIWQEWTRPKVEAFVDSTSRTPLVGLLGALVKDWIPLIDEYYYYTAP